MPSIYAMILNVVNMQLLSFYTLDLFWSRCLNGDFIIMVIEPLNESPQ